MNTRPVSPCPVCAHTESIRVFDAPDRNWGVPGVFTYVRCRGCGALRLDPHGYGPAGMAAYPAGYGTSTSGETAAIESRVNTRVNRIRLAALQRHHRGGRLLDVGCGSGFFMEAARRRGWRVAGVEPAADHAAFAREHLKLTGVIEDVWPSQRVGAERFDAVTMFHVIEHLASPVDALRAARALLEPGGIMMVETPNVRSLTARMFGSFWVALDAPRHLVLFSQSALVRCIERAGMRVVTCRTFSPSTMDYSESLRYAVRKRAARPAIRNGIRQTGDNGKTASARGSAVGLFHAMERSVYRILNAAGDRMGSGCNLLVIARK